MVSASTSARRWLRPASARATATTSLCAVTIRVERVRRQASIIEAWICASETISVSESASAWTTERFA